MTAKYGGDAPAGTDTEQVQIILSRVYMNDRTVWSVSPDQERLQELRIKIPVSFDL